MSVQKDVLGVVPGLMSVSLLAKNMKALEFNNKTKMGLTKIKPMSTKKMLKLGTTNVVGVALIGATAGAINGIN